MLREVVTCNCVRNPGGHTESNPRPSEEGASFYHVLRPLDNVIPMPQSTDVTVCSLALRLVTVNYGDCGVYSEETWRLENAPALPPPVLRLGDLTVCEFSGMRQGGIPQGGSPAPPHEMHCVLS